RAAGFSAEARAAGKPVGMVWVSRWFDGAPGSRAVETDRNLSLFRSMDRCFDAIAAWQARAAHDPAMHDAGASPVSTALQQQVAGELKAADKLLPEDASKRLLRLYGVPTVEERLVTTAAQARDAALALGMPVAMKVVSPDLFHKTEVGG